MESEKKPSILLVDDEKEVTDILFKRLSRRGYPCRTAGNGQEALDSMKDSPSEIVVLDVKMPVMDGLEATEKIRSLPRPDAACIPIIAMTANAFDEDVKKTAAAGMNEHLSKPINGQKLIATLLKYRKHDRNDPFANR